MKVQITRLTRYPVKSCAGSDADTVSLDVWGVEEDRRFLVVRASDGQQLTQREHPGLALLRPAITGDSSLRIDALNKPPLFVPPGAYTDTRRVVTVWSYRAPAEDVGDEAAAWLSGVLETDCRLVRMPRDWERPAGNAPATRPEDRAAFVDGYPLLLASEASLGDLNARLFVPVPMDRFRPNIVIAGAPVWAEDGWRTLTHAPTGAILRAAKPCARCAVITVDQETGEPDGPEPLRTLSGFRRDASGKVLFGLYLLHDNAAPLTLRVGDELRIG